MSLESIVVLSSLHAQAAREYLNDSLARPQTIAPLPRVCAQLAQLTAQQAVDAAQLARLIESDLALAGEVMRVANSPALRPRTAIVSLRQAVSWLVVAEVRNIAMAVMLHGEVFVAPGHEPESKELWREAWLAGLWAKEIARERQEVAKVDAKLANADFVARAPEEIVAEHQERREAALSRIAKLEAARARLSQI